MILKDCHSGTVRYEDKDYKVRVVSGIDNKPALYFKDPNHRHAQYRKFMSNLFSFTMGVKSKRKHDDAADSLAGLVAFEREGSGVSIATVSSSWI